ncbi:hypothetical protein GTP41_20840 [Pseudoduganella sp. DS3]|uniref:Uncharacterized protein n=1 Tax=Pseudoduganella guangdongensis TaxID=2692179 RepID=A0A6N9HMX5_9BURK|nr:hypothetical protein [Pseudoduganella guangdongensis]MYN04543.1 hypothetical protein [Pseudoduganella guangdongensis]
MTFGTSAYLEWRFALAPNGAARPLIAPLAELLGASPEEIDHYSKKPFRNGELEQLAIWTQRVVSVSDQGSRAKTAKKFWAAQALAMPILIREPLRTAQADPVAVRLLQVGADALYDAGYPQFEKLRQVCHELVNWLIKQAWKRVVLIESPLGNCVPVAVLHSLAGRAGLSTQVVTWNAPRNDRAGAGWTVSDSAGSLSSDVDPGDLVVFADDVITGTRFVKTFDALSKKFPGRVLPIAMAFNDPMKSETSPDQLKRVRSRASKAEQLFGYPHTFVNFPILPAFRIDAGAPVYWESPVIWGETDLVAGKRKVNLIFNLIDHLFHTLNDLTKPTSALAKYLHKAWQKDTTGASYAFAAGLREEVFSNLSNQLNIDEVRLTLDARAREAYPADFTGLVEGIDEEEVKQRWDWLRTTFLELAQAKLRSDEAYVLWRAFDETFAASHSQVRPRPSRDHAYAAYALQYNDVVRSFHERLVMRIALGDTV